MGEEEEGGGVCGMGVVQEVEEEGLGVGCHRGPDLSPDSE